jgi:hypothetical protein
MVTSAKRGDTAAERGAVAAVETGAAAAPVVPVPSVVRLFSGAFVPPLHAATPTVNATTYVHFFTFYPPSLHIFDLDRIAERHELRRN